MSRHSIDRLSGRLAIVPEWEAQKGAFGNTRKLRIRLFERGGHVRWPNSTVTRQSGGVVKTLEHKRRKILTWTG